MTSEQEKRLLRMACACDRLEIAVICREAAKPSVSVGGISLGMFGPALLNAAGALLPRRLRWLSWIWRAWRRFA